MNRTLIKNFSVWARRTLIEQVAAKAQSVGVTPSGIEEPEASTSDSITQRGKVYDSDVKTQRERLVRRLRRMEKDLGYQEAYEKLIDEIAYTWFNRFIALRYMEANGYIPRVLSSSTPGSVDPDLLRDAVARVRNGELPGIGLSEVERLRASGEREKLYRRLFVAQCNALNTPLPFLFDKIAAETALLLPPNLLHQESVIRHLLSDIPEEDWDDVEIVGWLYQHYISERKDEVFARKSTVPAKDIPAATQLFTPHWIVRYMVENSVGRLWIEAHPESNLREHMPYYVESAEQEPEIRAQIEATVNHRLTPEELTIMDPACGSGHILVYAFDLLYEIYRERGYIERDIPGLILTHNLHGLDIDERAAQLAAFAVMMKARAKNRRIFRDPPQLNIVSIQHTRDVDSPSPEWGPLLSAFREADNLGSVILPPSFDEANLRAQLDGWLNSGDLLRAGQAPKLEHLVHQASLLRRRYAAVVANPPYMGRRGFNETLRAFVDKYYAAGSQDLYGCFILLNQRLTERNGMFAMITIPNWMFLSTFEDLRKAVIEGTTVDSLIHLGRGMFGSDFGTCAFALRNFEALKYRGKYEKLYKKHVNVASPEILRQRFLSKERVYSVSFEDLVKIPGYAFAYWSGPRVLELFDEGNVLDSIADPRQGLATANNDRFLRAWFEPSRGHVAFGMTSREQARTSRRRWFPYNKGGEFRKWYGNQEWVVNWEDDGKEIRYFGTENGGRPRSRAQNVDTYFRASSSWSKVTSGGFALRYFPPGFVYDVAGCSILPRREGALPVVTGLLNSRLVDPLLAELAPTLNFEVGQVENVPIIKDWQSRTHDAKNLTDACIEIAQRDWDNFETSWNFSNHPLLRVRSGKVAEAFAKWQQLSEKDFRDLQRLEEENNRYWISAYGFEEDVSPEVPDEDITLRRAHRARDIRSLISYAVGCMMGRYSLDEPGLIHAGQPFDASRHANFPADRDAILPITDNAYFEDDAVSRFIEFLRVAYGPEHLTENLDYVADALTRKKNETAVGRIRRYFLEEFVKDHIQTYSKRPIYWLFTSGKQKGFNALVYLHRYDEGTLPRLRTEYLHELQPKLEAELVDARDSLERASTGTARKAAEKRVTALTAQLTEIRDYDEKLRHAADQRIRLDLDDGVAYNYTLFEGLLYEGSDLKMADLKKRSKWRRDLLAKAATAEAIR